MWEECPHGPPLKEMSNLLKIIVNLQSIEIPYNIMSWKN